MNRENKKSSVAAGTATKQVMSETLTKTTNIVPQPPSDCKGANRPASAVFRVEKERNYTVLANDPLDDRSLSYRARGLLATMLRLPDDWDFSFRGLVALSSDGKDAVRSALKELEAAGYVQREEVNAHDAGGRFTAGTYVVREYRVDFDTSTVADLPRRKTRHGAFKGNLNLNNQVLNTNTPLTPQSESSVSKDEKISPKPQKAKPTLDAQLMARCEEYSNGSALLLEAILDFADNRIALKKPILTMRSLNILLGKLDKLSGGSLEMKIALLESAIQHNWLSIYPLKESGSEIQAPAPAPETNAPGVRPRRRWGDDDDGDE